MPGSRMVMALCSIYSRKSKYFGMMSVMIRLYMEIAPNPRVNFILLFLNLT